MKKLTKDKKDKLFEYLEGTCNTVHSAIYHLGLKCDTETVEEAMLDQNLELCKGCGWWHESCELTPDPTDEKDEDEFYGYCDQCRKERGSAREEN